MNRSGLFCEVISTRLCICNQVIYLCLYKELRVEFLECSESIDTFHVNKIYRAVVHYTGNHHVLIATRYFVAKTNRG